MYNPHGFSGPPKDVRERKPNMDDRANSSTPFPDEKPSNMGYEAQALKPAFEDFFRRVVSEKPDYLILLDKGARPFGIPFKKFLNDLDLTKQPEIIFWNDSEHKRQDPAESAIPNDYMAHPEMHGKKLFFVDETYAHGTGARRIQDFLNATGEDGSYFAFSTAEAELSYAQQDQEIPERGLDDRFHVYDIVPANGIELFTKNVARGYVIDSDNVPSLAQEPVHTVPRYVETDDFAHKRIGNFDEDGIQEDVRIFRAENMETKKISDKAIYDVLSSIDKSKLLAENQ